MKLRHLLALLAFFIVGSAFQGNQQDMGETIVWQPGHKITWYDFLKPLKDGGNVEAAYSVCGIAMNSSPSQMDDSTVSVDIHAFFSKTLSSKSVKREMITAAVLKHEQDHFDLTELYARKLRKDLMDGHFRSVQSFYKSMQQMYNKTDKDLGAEQLKYDKETSHSINATEQEKWNGEIANALSKYDAYNNPKIRVVIRK